MQADCSDQHKSSARRGMIEPVESSHAYEDVRMRKLLIDNKFNEHVYGGRPENGERWRERFLLSTPRF